MSLKGNLGRRDCEGERRGQRSPHFAPHIAQDRVQGEHHSCCCALSQDLGNKDERHNHVTTSLAYPSWASAGAAINHKE